MRDGDHVPYTLRTHDLDGVGFALEFAPRAGR